jgi:hypothetical protein
MFNRRDFLKTVAVGAGAIAVGGSLFGEDEADYVIRVLAIHDAGLESHRLVCSSKKGEAVVYIAPPIQGVLTTRGWKHPSHLRVGDLLLPDLDEERFPLSEFKPVPISHRYSDTSLVGRM